MSFSVVIADNHDVTRWGVKSIVENRGGVVVSTAETGQEAVSMAETYDPDVVIMSLNLPLLNGFEVLCRFEQGRYNGSTILLTTFNEREHVRAAFDRGAAAYVLKQDPLGELDAAFDAVGRGECYLSASLPQELLEACSETDPTEADPHQSLTMREREILQLTAEGFTSREAGARLEISHRTVEKHRENIKEKLGLASVVDMVRYAYQRDLLVSPLFQKPETVPVA